MNSDDDYVDVVKMVMKKWCLCDDDQIDNYVKIVSMKMWRRSCCFDDDNNDDLWLWSKFEDDGIHDDDMMLMVISH